MASIYITGDKHGDFREVYQFCVNTHTTTEDLLVVLGDAGINFTLDEKDEKRKQALEDNIPVTLFSIHGNHEQRPFLIAGYQEVPFYGGIAYQQPRYPHQYFAKDGEIYDLNGWKVLVIGGASSIDKEFRIAKGWPWYESEQPDEEIKNRVRAKLESVDWKVDIVLSHTCPMRYMPTDTFRVKMDLSKFDLRTEEFLDEIEGKLQYKKWYCGHYHIEKKVDRLEFLFHQFKQFGIE